MMGQTTAAIKTHNNAWNRLSILNALGLHLPLPQQGQLRSDECGVGSGFLLQFPYIRLRIEKVGSLRSAICLLVVGDCTQGGRAGAARIQVKPGWRQHDDSRALVGARTTTTCSA